MRTDLAQTWQTTVVTTFELKECGECGIPFYVPTAFDSERRETGARWYCPNGHCRVYREKESTRLERELARAEARSKERLDWLHAEREAHAHTERRLRSTKAVVTKTKKRIAAGACPCCSERFPDLASHMAEAHPGYGPEPAGGR